jgi:hypothetical protein
MPGDLSQTLLDFIRVYIPTFQAAEVLLFFAANPDRDFSTEEVVVAMRPAVITVPAVREYMGLFTESRVITETNGRFKYDPSSPEIEGRIGELVRAYNERPVTLITAIYRIADSKIQSFADSFKLRKD